MLDHALMNEILEFVEERDWGQFHSPENLAKSISIESAELLELFQWSKAGESAKSADLEAVKNELADVMTYCLLLANRLDADPVQIMKDKLEITRKKYPVEKFKGVSAKYDQIPD